MEIRVQKPIQYEKFNQNDLSLEKACNMLSDLLPISRLTNMSSMVAKTEEEPKLDTRKFTIELITEDDKDEVLKLLKKFFFKDEPLNTYIELGECAELEKYSTKCIYENCSFKAVNENGEIIGVLLNGIISKPSPNEEPFSLAANCEHPKFKKIMAMMDHIDSQFNLFDLYPEVNEFLDAKIMSVDSTYRGLGIAGKLTDATLEWMTENNIKLISVLCSSHFSARVMEKMDFKEVFKMEYADYLVNGEQVFNPVPPHKAARILVKTIE